MVMAVMSGLMAFAEGNQQAAQMKAQAKQEEYRAAAERANAQIAERNREVEGKNAAEALNQARDKKELVSGQNTAALGSAGLESTGGLAAALDRANNSSFEKQSEKIRQNLFGSDLGLRQEVANRLQAAQAAEISAKNLRNAAKSTKRMSILKGIMATASGITGTKGAAGATKAKGGIEVGNISTSMRQNISNNKLISDTGISVGTISPAMRARIYK